MQLTADTTTAALVNGFAAHALDYDDTQHNCNTHMSAPVLGAAFTLAGVLHCSGKELLAAYVAGFELGCRLGRVRRFGRHLQQQGFHPTGVLGHFGATAAATRLMGLDAGRLKHAWGIAATQTSGLTRSFGTMCKPMNAANASHDAVLCARLAQLGFTGPLAIFDSDKSLFSIYGFESDTGELLRDLGREFEIRHNTIKVYACAGWRNPIVEAAIALATTHALKPQDVSRVTVSASADQTRLPNYPRPRSELETKFSVEHATAVALIDRAGGMAQFCEERRVDPVVSALRERVTLETVQDLEPYQIRVCVQTSDGRKLTHFIAAQKGDPRNPLSWEEIDSKFTANALSVVARERASTLSEMVEHLEKVGDVAELMHLCRPG
jgi:2-methylcitrate dehydratase PrpD